MKYNWGMTDARLYDAVDVLYARAAPIRAVQGGEVNQFRRALDLLAEVAIEIDSPLAIVGGLAAIYHGVPVTTADIVVSIASERADAFLQGCQSRGFVAIRQSPEGWHFLRLADASGEVGVEVIPAGRKSPRDPEYAPPKPHSAGSRCRARAGLRHLRCLGGDETGRQPRQGSISPRGSAKKGNVHADC